MNRIFWAAFFLLVIGHVNPLYSAELCVKKNIRARKNGRINLAKSISIADKCSPKQTSLLNTDSFVGSSGAQGPGGNPGPQGPRGEPGPLLETLPSGATLRGEFRVGALAPEIATGFIAFPFPLEATPVIAWVNTEISSNPNCPGTAANPEAAPGFFCLYSPPSYTSNWSTIEFGNVITRYGFRLRVSGLAMSQFHFGGGWAVTAP